MEWLNDNELLFFPCILSADEDDKKPRIKGWQKLKKSSIVQLNERVGVPTGTKSGFTVIDIDVKDMGLEVWKLITKKYDIDSIFYGAIQVRTQHGGIHYYMEYDETLKNSSKLVKLLDKENGKFIDIGIDIRNDGGYIIAPPSQGYTFINEFKQENLRKIPNWFKTLITQPIKYEDGEYKFITELDRLRHLPVKCGYEQPLTITSSYKFEPSFFKDMLYKLDKRRYETYDEWIKVCFATGSVAQKTGVNLLDVLKDWSAQSKKYNPQMVEQLYHEANNKLSIGSIWYWIKEDNFEEYNNLITQHNRLYNIVYYYEDYVKLIEEYKKNRILSVSIVKQYLKDSIKKVINGGNHIYFSVSVGVEIPEYVRLNGDPTKCINFKFKEKEGDDDEIPLAAIFSYMETHNELDTYDRLDYIPYLVSPNTKGRNVLNLFKPFPFQYKPEYTDEDKEQDFKNIEPLLNHVKFVCGDDEQIYKYYMNYIAHTFQKPDEKPEVFCAFIAKMGIGKDAFSYDFLSQLFGTWNCIRVSELGDMLSKFNKQFEGKLWYVISELQDKERVGNISTLKAVITNKTKNIEPKGKDVYTILDFGRYTGFGNIRNCLSISPDDRRFVITENTEKPKPRDYYDNLYTMIKNKKIQQSFFDYITHYDISSFNPRVLPETHFKLELQHNSIHNAIRFIIDELHISSMDKNTTANDLFDSYTNWANNNGETKKSNKKNFIMKIQEVGITTYRSKKDLTSKVRKVRLNRKKIIQALKDNFKYEMKHDEESDNDGTDEE